MNKDCEIFLRKLVPWIAGGLAAAVVVFTPESKVYEIIPVSSIFTGLLSFTGFLFTARTFITFKARDVIYEDEGYAKEHEKLVRSGLTTENLYAPLEELDRIVGSTAVNCLTVVLVICGATFFGIPTKENPISCWLLRMPVGVVYGGAVFAIVNGLLALTLVNRTIKEMVEMWKKTAPKIEFQNSPEDDPKT